MIKARHIFTMILIVVMGGMSVGAFAYQGTAAFGFPFAVASLVFLMAIGLLVAELRADAAERSAPAGGSARAVRTDTTEPEAAEPPEAKKADPPKAKTNIDLAGVAKIYGFLIGFLAIAHFVSFMIAVPLLLFLMCHLFCKESWQSSALLAGIVGIFVFLVFGQVLNTF